MTLAKTDPPRTAAPDVAKADVEGHAYTWYDPDSADFDSADRWAPVDPTEDDEAAARLRLSAHRRVTIWRPRQD